MSDVKQNEFINNFFQIFADSITKTLSKNLDTDVCSKIKFSVENSSKVADVETLKEDKVVYKIDFTTGNRQGTLAALIPEELIAVISDVLTGGNGDDVYKGSLSEIETNSTAKIFEKVFRNIENDFKKKHDHNLVFSSSPLLLLKEIPEYKINSEDYFFDFLIRNTLTLNENKKFDINIVLNNRSLENLMKDLGLLKPTLSSKKTDLSKVDVSRLADVKINITAELGKTRVPIKYALELVRGSLVELDTLNNSDIKVFANGVEFAHAQVVAVEDNFGLKITKIIPPEERLASI